MIAYTIAIIDGCIHKVFIELQVGTTTLCLQCAPLRSFIRAAKKEGIYKVLEAVPECQREVLAFIYEEFEDVTL